MVVLKSNHLSSLVVQSGASTHDLPEQELRTVTSANIGFAQKPPVGAKPVTAPSRARVKLKQSAPALRSRAMALAIKSQPAFTPHPEPEENPVFQALRTENSAYSIYSPNPVESDKLPDSFKQEVASLDQRPRRLQEALGKQAKIIAAVKGHYYSRQANII